MTKELSSTRTITILVIMMFATMGVGSLVEMTEFWGYLYLGEGDGVLFFGGGDTDPVLINEVGGGWINAMEDLVNNFLGGLLAIIIFIFVNLTKPSENFFS